ncbi:MAG: biotin--[acetyl-CoA-carboxylase] ligase [Propionibacteriaceae bacterium]|jgi:BirA family biotin operon repressor/biotin-[acetyl-CoA-carboxylase] ligase|nr:biotin--[acetyl-CoA-carboxylase] ligase [Propionibacteriaceae bacterium]
MVTEQSFSSHASRLTGDSCPWELEFLPTVTSTDDELAMRVSHGCPPYKVLISTEQTSGGGRLGRGWFFPPGTAVAMSLALPVERFAHSLGLIPLAVGVGVVDAVTIIGGTAQVKWPNDVLIGDKKLCGIRVRIVQGIAVVGVGVNVSQSAQEIGVDTAISLAMAGVTTTNEDVIVEVLNCVGTRLDMMGHRDHLLLDDYRKLSATLGRDVDISVDEHVVVSGRAVDINEDGALLVEVSGDIRTFYAGDVFHCRTAP